MLLANAKHNGREKIILSYHRGGCIDFTAALQQLHSSQWGTAAASRIHALFESGRFEPMLFAEVLEFVEQRNPADYLLSLADCKLQAPFARPGQIIALARNYSVHAKESHTSVDESTFIKARNAAILTEETMSINGKQIHLG